VFRVALRGHDGVALERQAQDKGMERAPEPSRSTNGGTTYYRRAERVSGTAEIDLGRVIQETEDW
jgi:hypothetical protein